MNLRFGKQQEFSVQFCRVIPALLSTNVNQDWESVFKAVRMYQSMFEDTEENIKLEYKLWVAKWQAVELEYRPSTAIEALQACGSYFPNMSILLEILAVLPVSTAQPERMFSKMERTQLLYVQP